ncbi:transposase [Terribacillus sp. DMT04]|nr:transposase [Terribacillus sp. DMT04]
MSSFYDSTDYHEAEQALEDWCSHYLFHGAGATKRIAKTILQWKKEILNYFVYNITNARLEGTNNLIKTLKRRSYGCPNLYKFNLRIRMECRQPA